MTKGSAASDGLQYVDPEIYALIEKELNRQRSEVELIASENFVSHAVLEAQGSILTNKYAEGYPGARYYGGCQYVDEVERLAIERVKTLFAANFANVQPHSGSQANQAAFFALLQPHDQILGLSLDCGGHLTHGSRASLSGRWFSASHYGIHKETGLIDYDSVRALAEQHKPKLIIAGWSAYPRVLDFKKFREIADLVGAYLMVDMAHFAGLVATGYYPNPLIHAHVVTSTTHKTLRGPRGGIILTNEEEIAKKINKAVFPGIQGGPLMHVIAAKAVGFLEASIPEYKTYIGEVVRNAQTMCKALKGRGYSVLTGGTDSHLLLLDLRAKGITGKGAEVELGKVGITVNKNSIPFDDTKPTITSGIRIGTPAMTTRGFLTQDFQIISELIADVLDCIVSDGVVSDLVRERAKEMVSSLCTERPLY